MYSAAEILAWLEQYYWPFLRISALFLAAPIFSASSFPVRIRILLAAVITGLIAPSITAVPDVDILGPAGILIALQQILIGLGMGFIVQMAFATVVIAGQALAMAMGLGFAMSVDPQNGVQVPSLSQFYLILATLLFLSANGHLLLIQLVADSFAYAPVAMVTFGSSFGLDIVMWASQMFTGGLVLALPALTAVLLINVAFGVITRAAPQLNIFAVGFPVTIAAGFIFVFLTIPSVSALLLKLFDSGLAHAFLVFR